MRSKIAPPIARRTPATASSSASRAILERALARPVVDSARDVAHRPAAAEVDGVEPEPGDGQPRRAVVRRRACASSSDRPVEQLVGGRAGHPPAASADGRRGDQRQRVGRRRRRRPVEGVRGVDRAAVAASAREERPRPGRDRRPATSQSTASWTYARPASNPDGSPPDGAAGRHSTPPSAATVAQSGTSDGAVGGQLVEQPPRRRRHRLPARSPVVCTARDISPRRSSSG